MQSRKRVCDICPNRGRCTNQKLKSSGKNETIIERCPFAGRYKHDLSMSLMDLAVNSNDMNLMVEASTLVAHVSTLAIQELEEKNKCLFCSSKRICPFFLMDNIKNTFLVCPKESAIKSDQVLLRFNREVDERLKLFPKN